MPSGEKEERQTAVVEEPKIEVRDDIEVADEKDAEKKKDASKARTHLEPGPCAFDIVIYFIAWPGHRCDHALA